MIGPDPRVRALVRREVEVSECVDDRREVAGRYGVELIDPHHGPRDRPTLVVDEATLDRAIGDHAQGQRILAAERGLAVFRDHQKVDPGGTE